MRVPCGYKDKLTGINNERTCRSIIARLFASLGQNVFLRLLIIPETTLCLLPQQRQEDFKVSSQ
jgi:hypothetical protein